jgi:hypothetical protein
MEGSERAGDGDVGGGDGNRSGDDEDRTRRINLVLFM